MLIDDPQSRANARFVMESDLLAFARYFFRLRMGTPFLYSSHHETIVNALTALYRGDIPNLCINMPPGGTKTELAVINFIAWCFARSPRCRFLHLSASDVLAALNSATAREIVQSEEYQLLWPRSIRQDTRAKKHWSLEVDGKTTGGVYATASGGQVTGFRAGFIQPGFSGAIIIDDPLKATDAWSQAKREAVNRTITNTIRSRRAHDKTPIILIMQRLHEDDPAAHALAGDLAATFHHVEIQGIIDEGTPQERSYWEDKESLASLQALRESDPYTFYSQYQQRPTPPGGAMIKSDWIQRYDTPPTVTTLAIVMDTAFKTEEAHDYSVLALFGLGESRNVFVMDIDRGKWESPELLDRAVAFIHKHRPRRPSPVRLRGVFVEDKASGTGLVQNLKRMDEIRNVPIFPVPRSRDKVSRVHDVLPYIRAGQLWVPDDSIAPPWLCSYLGELASFSPAMTHRNDDQVDVTVDGINELIASEGGLASYMDLS
jgi:predicted phage terminase large subunit-like protein